MGPYYYWWGGWWMIFPMVVLIALLVIILLGYGRNWFRPPFERHERDPRDRESPMDILRYRYAKGEITKDEFEQLKKDLTS